MSAPSLTELKKSVSSQKLTDEKMEQVREILFGDYERQIEDRVTVLEERIESLELSLNGRLDALQVRLDAVLAKIDATQLQALSEIGHGLQELAERVKSVKPDCADNEKYSSINEQH